MYDYETSQPAEVLVYLRKSRSDDPLMTVDEVLEKHEKILNDWIEKNLGAPVPPENYYREIVSGETIDGRPQMQKLLHRIEHPGIKAVLVVEVQRLSRGDLEDCGRLMKLLRYTDTRVITPMKTYNLTDEYDRDGFERELKRGNEYLEYFKKIQKRGRLSSVESGNFVGSIPPYGYDKTFVMDGKRRCPTLTPNEKEAPVVRMIFEWFVNDRLGPGKCAARLNAMGIPSRTGKPWTYSRLRDLIRNEHYTGKIRWGLRPESKSVLDMDIKKHRGRNSDYILVDGRHSAIVPEELFEQAQKLIGNEPRINYARRGLVNIYSGIVFCKRCSHSLVARSANNGESYYLHCSQQNLCHNGSITVEELTKTVVETLQKNIDDFRVCLSNASQTDYEKELLLLSNRMHELEQKELSMWDKYTSEGMPREVFEQLKIKVEKDKAATRKALDDIRNTPTTVRYEEKIRLFSDVLNGLTDKSIDAKEKNLLVKSCISRIEIDRPRAERNTGKHTKSSKNGWITYSPTIEIRLKV